MQVEGGKSGRKWQRRGWVAFLLSWVGPGLGYIHSGRPGLAYGLYAAVHALHGLILNGAARYFSTFAICGLLMVTLVGASSLDAKRRAQEARAALAPWYRRWLWVVPILLSDLFLLPRLLPALEDEGGPLSLPRTRYSLAHSTTGSMLPTLHPGDIEVWQATAGSSWIRRGDVIVFRRPEPGGPPLWAKRCVALAGDWVEIREGRLWINGRDGGPCPFPREVGPPRTDLGPLVVPPGHIYCVGDNRGCSYDSRHWGPLPVDAVRGRVLYTLWPGSGGPRERWQRIGRRPGPA